MSHIYTVALPEGRTIMHVEADTKNQARSFALQGVTVERLTGSEAIAHPQPPGETAMRITRYMLLTLALAAATMAAAAEPNQYASVPGSQCRATSNGPNNPNNASFAAKAIGARNESTTASVFVICPFVLTPTPIEGGVVTELNLSAYTVDGKPHDMTCTAVIGSLNRPVQPTYSAVTMTVYAADPSLPTVFTWGPDDFNGASPTGGIVGSAWATVTCNVPPQTAIALMYAKQNPTIR